MTYYICDKPWESEILGITDGLSQAKVDEKGFKNKNNFETFKHSFGSPLKRVRKLPMSSYTQM
jgi:hypothetical protein